jgi:PAS domain S-box-containing protein
MESQQSLALTLDSIGAGFVATDRRGRVIRLNAVAEQVMGWRDREAQGQSFWEVFNREDRPAHYVAISVVDLILQEGLTVDVAKHVIAISRDGRRTALEVKAGVTRLDDGSLSGMAMIFRDMGPLIKAEVESHRLAAIVEFSNDAIIGKTLDGRITSWNSAAEAIFGYAAEEAIGQPIEMLIPADRQSEEMRILSELSQDRRVPPFDTLRLSKAGKLLHVSVTISPICDPTGRVIGASKIARDVSQQRRAEAALRGSEARLRFTLDAAQIGDWYLDMTSKVVRGSLQFARCFGYEQPLENWTIDTLMQHIHANDRSRVQESFAVAMASMTDLRVECRVIWPDPGLHWISLHGNFEAEAEKPWRMLGIVTETTQQRLAEEARLKAQRLEGENQQILEANRLKSQFMANMSHELRTPLNSVIGFARLLESGAVPAGSVNYQKFLGNIGISGRHLLQLVNDVLDLSKVESGTFEFSSEPLDLNLTVREVSDALHPAMESKRIAIDMDVDGTLTDIQLDVSRLKQVLYNLLSNAIKFSPAGSEVKVRAFAQGPDHFRIEVQDNGIGIAAQDLPRLFIEFQQLDSGYSKKHEGTGLGLALTRRLVEAQGGSVGVESTLGVGSIFYVLLNRIHGTDTTRKLNAEFVNVQEALPASMRVLVIEDLPDARFALLEGLVGNGYSADGASTGQAAIERASQTSYDGIWLDLKLNDRQGLRVLADIRQGGASSAAPVMGLTIPTTHGAVAAFPVSNLIFKPLSAQDVMRVMAPLSRFSECRARVLVIDDDLVALEFMRAILADLGIDAFCAPDGRLALRDIADHNPDAIVLGLAMAGFDGLEVIDALRRMSDWRDIPIFVICLPTMTDDDYERLTRSATEITARGGAVIASIFGGVLREQPAVNLYLNRSV